MIQTITTAWSGVRAKRSKSPERQQGESFAAYQLRRAALNASPKAKLLWDSAFRPPAVADAYRRKRRALIKQVGARQFKKLYKGAQA